MKVTSSRTIGATEFKARCLELMDEVARTNVSVVVTKRGKPVVRVSAAGGEPVELFGALKGAVIEVRDIVSPLTEPWDAER